MSRTRYTLAGIAAGTFASACDSLAPTGIGGPHFKSDRGDGAGQFMTLITQNTLHGTRAPASTKTVTYGTLVSAGFQDAWADAHAGDEGLTCCHDASLVNPIAGFDQRLDLVLLRGFGGTGFGEVVGEELTDFSVTNRWPSDHAGLFMAVRLP